MLLPDTNVWIQLINDKNPKLKSRWGSVSLADIAVCAIVKAELWHGAHKYLQPESRRRIVDSWLAPYHSFPFDDAAAHHYAELRHSLEACGEVIGPNDLKIAAICIAHDLTLVTGNVGEFRRVPGLQVEDWSQG